MNTESLLSFVSFLYDQINLSKRILLDTPKWRVIRRIRLKEEIRTLKTVVNYIYGGLSCGTTLDKH